MLPFRVLPRTILDIRANLPPFAPSAAPSASTPATGRTVCKSVTLKTPTDICIPFLFNRSSTLRLRCNPTERHLSPFLSPPCRHLPFQQGGTPPFPSCHVGRIPCVSERVCPGPIWVATSLSSPRNRGKHGIGRSRCNGFDVASQWPVLHHLLRMCPHQLVRLSRQRPGLQRSEQVDPLAGGQQLNGDRMPQIVQHLFEPPRPAHSHGHVIFLISRSRNRIHRMGSGQRLVFARQRRRRHLRNHEARIQSRLRRQKSRQHARQWIGYLLKPPLYDSAERCNRDGHLVRRHRQRLPVKISAADNVAIIRVAHKNQRIVGRAVQLHCGHFARLRQRITHRSVHLRRTAQTVSILNARIFF